MSQIKKKNAASVLLLLLMKIYSSTMRPAYQPMTPSFCRNTQRRSALRIDQRQFVARLHGQAVICDLGAAHGKCGNRSERIKYHLISGAQMTNAYNSVIFAQDLDFVVDQWMQKGVRRPPVRLARRRWAGNPTT